MRYHLFVFLCLFLIAGFVMGIAPSAHPQAGVGVGSSRPEHETSRVPLKIKFSGVINTHPGEMILKPAEDSLGIIKFSIGVYRETYEFEVVNLEAVGRERVTPRAILEGAEGREVVFDVTGPNDLLSKIAQSEPGTPLTITGFLQQRECRMQVTEVETIGLSN
jgi:hypothetical protein